jgi:hypothetical protein
MPEGCISIPSTLNTLRPYRRNAGAGTFTATGVSLLWNYAANSVLITDDVEIKVYAIEMVYVPEAPF